MTVAHIAQIQAPMAKLTDWLLTILWMAYVDAPLTDMLQEDAGDDITGFVSAATECD